MGTEAPATVHFKLDGIGHVVAEWPAGPTQPEISLSWIQAQLLPIVPSDYDLDQDALTQLVAALHMSTTGGSIVIGTQTPPAVVGIDPDGSAAYLTVKLRPQQALNHHDILQALARAGVCVGIMEDVVQAALSNPPSTPVCIARALAPVPGQHGRCQSAVEALKARHRVVHDAHSSNFREMGDILVVGTGEILLSRTPPTPGQDGKTVRGDPIPAVAGVPAQFPAFGTGIGIDPEHPDQLIALQAGQVRQQGGTLSVEPVLTLARVDLSSGNIRFPGHVLVSGDVTSGMQIDATGDVVVKGMVETGAVIVARGDIVVHGGVKGQTGSAGELDALATRLHAQQHVQVRFAENASLEAGDCIQVMGYAMQSQLVAAQQVIVGKPGSGSGRIVACRIRAGTLIQTGTLGLERGGANHLAVGFHPAEARALEHLQASRSGAVAKLEELRQTFKYYTDHPEKISPEMLIKLSRTAELQSEQLHALDSDIAFRASVLQACTDACVIVEKAVYPVLHLSIAHYNGRFGVAKHHPVTFYADTDKACVGVR
jgi:uncharacterized protein (DUF342 family)